MKREALGYAVTGGLAAVVDIGGFHWLTRAAPPVDGVLLPATLSFGMAVVVNYLLTSHWVFRRDWRDLRQAGRFFGLACVGLAINTATTTLLALALHPTLAKAGGVAVAFGANFLMNAFWVFGAGAAGGASGLRSPCAGACGHAPAAPGRTRHRAAGATAWRRRPSARE
jgi:putative flippase GtrA